MVRRIILMITVSFSFLAISQEIEIIGQVYDQDLVKSGDKLGVKNNDECVIPLGNYTGIEYDHKNEVFRCYINKKEFIGFIYNEDWNTVMVNSGKALLNLEHSEGNESYQITTSNGIGLIDNEGNEIFKPIYDKITLEFETYNQCCINYIIEKENKKGLYIKGWVLDPEYSDFTKLQVFNSYYDNFLITTKNDKQGLVNIKTSESDSKTILENNFDEVKYLGEDENNILFCLVRDGKKSIFSYNTESELSYTTQYFDKLNWKKKEKWENAFIIPVNKNKFLITTLKEKEIVVNDYFNSEDNDFIAIQREDELYQVAQLTHEFTVFPNVYSKMVKFNYGLAVSKNEKWGFIQNPNLELEKILIYNSFEELKEASENGDF